jgi:hypothetical protein
MGTAKRLTLGFTWVQGGNSERTEYHNGLPKPFLSMDKLSCLTQGVRHDLSKILTRGQLFLDKVYSSPYPDSARTRLFGCPMADRFSRHCLSKFEVVGVFVESNATLNRHMDYHRTTPQVGITTASHTLMSSIICPVRTVPMSLWHPECIAAISCQT